jgi:hypothetical protein
MLAIKDERDGETRELPSDEDTLNGPVITLMTQEEVLVMYQMSAEEIGSAGCWWGNRFT